jgi:hypothetical protein
MHDRVQHDLDGHELDEHVAAREEADGADPEEDRAERQVFADADVHVSCSPRRWPACAPRRALTSVRSAFSRAVRTREMATAPTTATSSVMETISKGAMAPR